VQSNNTDKIILDLCGGSGAWSKPYKDAGYDVRLITLPEDDVRYYNPPKNVYGVLAAPPCTEFSRAKSTAPRDFAKGMETVEACMKIIWDIQKREKLQFWALENPMGLLSRFLGNPPYFFEQWWFGNDRTKLTHLWGRFTIPKRIVSEKPIFLQRSSHNKNSDWYSNASAAKRAITPAGFARAFFKANP
jgi:hypothetical protein